MKRNKKRMIKIKSRPWNEPQPAFFYSVILNVFQLVAQGVQVIPVIPDLAGFQVIAVE